MRGQELKGEWKDRMRDWVVAALCYPWCKESEDKTRGFGNGADWSQVPGSRGSARSEDDIAILTDHEERRTKARNLM